MTTSQRVRISLAAVLTAASLSLPVSTASAYEALGPAVVLKSYTAKVKCSKIRLSDNNAVGFVFGTGRGRTKPAAVAAAKKNANDSVGRGYRAKHCRTISVH
ncbi:hypothetical protein ACH4LN_02500 [Streptomyces albus]|uniref:Uncharacterized protein n=1 Tax=Streptomyces albus TaxID=1888 RepID=A0A6C1CCU2_9ACTN|nr:MULTISPECIES: hypothetical protein [Streptomyces]KPC68935.1 hypothetical protein ADL27_56190 [Streptomyces sp. NRRL F-6602]EPD92427.1 hypothetical protein HMPREF1486_04390 [Streptomyces sp. HPH0547]QID39372.1 hypothetical protein G3260_006212 [Streptomyces albus]TGG86107.1 hypothetical protein D8771_06765 [Streptomyces albus]UVN53573.1 hypothetical protein NR995_02890 [Streptomyces albus]